MKNGIHGINMGHFGDGEFSLRHCVVGVITEATQVGGSGCSSGHRSGGKAAAAADELLNGNKYGSTTPAMAIIGTVANSNAMALKAAILVAAFPVGMLVRSRKSCGQCRSRWL